MPEDMFFNLAGEKRMKIIRAAIDQSVEYTTALRKLETYNDQMFHFRRGFLNQCPKHINRNLSMPLGRLLKRMLKKENLGRILDTRTAAYVMLTSISNLEFYHGEKEVKYSLNKTIGFS